MLATSASKQWLAESKHDAWLDEGPQGFADGPNKYRYAGNDPINFRDPTGERAAGNPLQSLGRAIVRTAATAFRTYRDLASTTIDVGAGLAREYITSRPTRVNTQQTTGASRQPSRDGSQVVGYITPGAPIVKSELHDLPGIRAAFENPGTHIIANHQGQGYLVGNPDGSARFITGDAYLPIETRFKNLRIESRAASVDAGSLSFIETVLISMSPAHEAFGDIYSFATLQDYYDPTLRYSGEDRRAMFLAAITPGANSRQIRYSEKVLDGFQQIRLFDLPQFKRGKYAELDPKLLPQGRQGLPFNAEIIDAPPGISVTTIDVSKPSFQTRRGIVNRVNSKSARLIPLDVEGKQLRIGIPDDVPLTSEQLKAFDRARETLEAGGVELILVPLN